MTNDELKLLEIELDTQIEIIKVSRTQSCLKIAPKQTCQAALVCESSSWITCLAAVLVKCLPQFIGQKAKDEIVFDELVRQGYFVTDSL